MASQWTKQLQKLPAGGYLNSGSGLAVVGGSINTLPANVPSPMFNQDLPGDRMILGEEDALAAYDSRVGILYGGMYTFVLTYATVTAAYTRGRAVFWDTSVTPSFANRGILYRVIPDESGSQGVAPFAGVLINTLTAGYAHWVQNAGKVLVRMRADFTGVPANGCAVYLAAAGAGVDVGTFDVMGGPPNPTFSDIDNALVRYVGWAEGLPVAAGITIPVNMPLRHLYRW
jgi:hypothetical protein